MSSIKARNRAGSPSSPMDDTIEVRLLPSIQAAHDEREYNLNRASPKTAEPRTMPDVSAATRRERDIWGTSPLDRSPRRSPASGYPNLENPEDSTQKRKRSPSMEKMTYRPEAQRVRSRQYQQHQRRESELLPRILTATETAAAAIATVSAAAAVSAPGASREKELEPLRASAEPRDTYDLPRERGYTAARAYADEEREQQQRREEQQREQQRVDMWISQTNHEGRQSKPPFDPAAYHQRSGSMQSPANEHAANDSHQQDNSAPHASASPQSEYGANSPDDDERTPIYGTAFSPGNQKIGPPLQQTDPKRRKRNFSNRTKTGCLTCRKRKKKCDETKPECSNCVRGGFICAGYPPQKGPWGKPDPAKPTVQIESKDPTYVPPGAYGMPSPVNGLQGGTFPQQRRESLPLYRGQALRIEPPQGRLLLSDDDRPTASTLPSALTSADSHNKLSALSAFSAPANVFPTPISAATTTPFPDRTPKENQRVPPLHDLKRGSDPETPQMLTPLPQINIHPSGSPPYRQPSPQQSQQLPRQLPQPQVLHHRQHSQIELPRPHEHERELDHGIQQHEHSMQHAPQNPHQSHPQLPSPQQFHPQHPQHRQHQQHQQYQPHQHPAHHPSQPMPEHRSQPPLHRQPRQGPLHQDPMAAERQPRFLHQFTQQSHMPQQQQQPMPAPAPAPLKQEQQQQQQQQPLETVDDGPESREAEEARAASRRNVPFFSTVPGPRREMEEMLAGRPFYQFDNQLVDARERCVAACWKFNNSTNPNIGVSQSERSRLFKEILQPRGSEIHGPPGAVGDQVVVDAPFHADYGYNISIGNAVHIGRNCHFSDAMPISIGHRVTIGPNVSFFTAAPSTDPMERDGVHSALQGRRITIEDDVFIGGNVTILAGVRVGKGAVIGAGSVVTSSATATLLS
ncbi:hypothetical protein SCUCBS95973_001773 [Sporothrix curviconia]|uniref:Zn(2)-C6 fungal-type domain-containing protein n=1 Tax=Sporothrix curviconia TaxID=1260050 RepID=A0ABP0B1K8_9PEZI